MTTVNDIVTQAFKKVGIVAYDEDMDAAQAQIGLDAFNNMVSAWPLYGSDVLHTDAALADAFPLKDSYREGVVYMLGARLAPNWSMPVGFDQDDFFRKIQADSMVVDEATFEAGLTTMPSQYTRLWSA